jgi:hypothetical protein
MDCSRVRNEFEVFNRGFKFEVQVPENNWLAFSLELLYRKAVGSQEPGVAAAATLGYGINQPVQLQRSCVRAAQPVPGWNMSTFVPRVEATLGFEK